MLLEIGFKEVDVSFPSASQTEFDFTRRLVESPDAVPDDVWIQVLTPCRKEHIRRTVDSVTGAKRATLSLYIASSDNFLDTVIGLSQDQVFETVVECVKYARSISKDDHSQSRTKWNLMFSPEAFSDTSVHFTARLCEAAREAWESNDDDEPVILNLPATVEMSTPNTYADQVELFCRSLPFREKVCVSLHPHNDRGCAVAAAELGQLAGADRVEGCLFGNGERTGNVDLVTLALNLYSHGIPPNLDFSNLPAIRKIFEAMSNMTVPDRMPYSGDYVFRAYSGSHQDAINKGFKRRQQQNGQSKWKIPYLSIDPLDIGLNYEAVILVNSQSGKGGVGWSLESVLGVEIPRGLALEFSKTVKQASEALCATLPPEEIRDLLFQTYHVQQPDPRILLARHWLEPSFTGALLRRVEASVMLGNISTGLAGVGEGIPAAVSNAVHSISGQHLSFSVSHLPIAPATGYTDSFVVAEAVLSTSTSGSWGVSMQPNSEQAELLACLSSAMVSSNFQQSRLVEDKTKLSVGILRTKSSVDSARVCSRRCKSEDL